ncbi:MAG: translation initiation factor IF-2 [Nitrososphaerota archaeon]|nr:translation initiation factor IF-2 [Nitrososphaerota archaeon]MDG6950291.1 translation initiation factor IF-2 [Nitrososphaerota archaeon]
MRQPVVVILGHVDSGKCVSGETLLQSADGTIVEAKEAFETYKSGEPIGMPDGVAYHALGLKLISMGPDGKTRPHEVSHVWKLRADVLIRVDTKAGYSVETTPEHRFLVVTEGGVVSYAEARQLKLGDRLLIPNRTTVDQTTPESVKSAILERIPDDFLVRPTPELAEEIRQAASRGHGGQSLVTSVRGLRRQMSRGYFRASAYRALISKLGLALEGGYEQIAGVKFSPSGPRGGRPSPWISLPKSDEEFDSLAYLVGLLYGDGITETALSNGASLVPIQEFKRCLGSAFRVTTTTAKRPTSLAVSHRGGLSLSRFLSEVFACPTTKKHSLAVPPMIAAMPDRFVAAFLRGFFDAKGFVTDGGDIGVRCDGDALAKQLPMLLQRFGCLAYRGNGSQSNEILISGKISVSAFNQRIGFRDPGKAEAARRREGFAERSRIFETASVSGDSPMSVTVPSEAVLSDRLLTRIESYGRSGKSVLARSRLAPPTYPNAGHEQALADCSAVEVTRLERSEGEFDVYDFTVDETHNFLANCLIIHNTSIADCLRGTGVQAREVGGITQEIGASFFPMETLQAICGPLLDRAGGELQVPGLLMIDTPGHAVFSNLRLRGGSAADIAILVVDVLKGLENQTLESIDILKRRRVPFLVALNKIDMINGWRKGSKGPLLQVIKDQPPSWGDELEERLYNVVGGLSRLGFQADAYYRVKDFRQQVSIVPVSARAPVGMPEMLAMLIGLAQQFLKGKLSVAGTAPGRGIILELQEEVGIGQTANVILTEGNLRVGDSIALVRRDGAFKSKVKALFMPRPLDEMRDPRDKFTPVDAVSAAAGVKLVSPDLGGVVAGTSVASFSTELQFQNLKAEMEKELSNIVVKTDNMGVIVKAGSIGGLEALLMMLEERGVPVREADIGDISKSDIVNAQVVGDHDPYLGAILGFDSKVLPEAKEYAGSSPIFVSSIIYEVIDSYANWAAAKRDADEKAALSSLTRPCKLKVLPGAFFRRNDPAVFGVDVVAGRLRPKVKLMSSVGAELGVVGQVQDNGKAVPEAKEGEQVAISVHGPTLGRQVRENDILYTMPRSHEAKLLRTKLLGSLTEDEKQVLDEIVAIKSAADPMYGF